MPKNNRRATIKDVATKAGVSPTTVSHALNNKGSIAPETKLRIEQAAEELGYRPNPVARGLRQSRLGIIALVMRPLDSLDTYQPEGVDYFMRFTGSAALTALQHGFSLMLMTDPTRDDAPISSLVADGCIIADPIASDPVITFLQSKQMPLITVGLDPDRRGEFSSVYNPSRDESLAMLTHLEQSGGTRIALVSGTDENDWNIDSRETYRRWCLEREQDPIIISLDETRGLEGGHEAFARLRAHPAVDAVYCLTGRHAAGFTEAAIKAGLSVPGDLLVAGGSDSVQTRTMSPSVTAFDLRPEDTAAVAVATLIAMLDAPTSAQVSIVPGPTPRLLVRESTTRA